MEATKKKLKVYCETSFWSWLVSRPSTEPDHAVKQAWTRKWWEESALGCEIFISEHVLTEAARGDSEQVRPVWISLKVFRDLMAPRLRLPVSPMHCFQLTRFRKTR